MSVRAGRLLTTRELVGLVGVHPETILRWHRAGRLRGYRLAAGVPRFRGSEIEAWVDASACTPREAKPRPVVDAGRRSSADGRDALLTRTDLHELGFERRAVDSSFRACPIVALPRYRRPER